MFLLYKYWRNDARVLAGLVSLHIRTSYGNVTLHMSPLHFYRFFRFGPSLDSDYHQPKSLMSCNKGNIGSRSLLRSLLEVQHLLSDALDIAVIMGWWAQAVSTCITWWADIVLLVCCWDLVSRSCAKLLVDVKKS